MDIVQAQLQTKNGIAAEKQQYWIIADSCAIKGGELKGKHPKSF